MPDLLTHFSVAYLLRRNAKTPHLRATFYLGAILPDIVTRPVYILYPKAFWAIMPLHTPIALTLLCLLISYVFHNSIRKIVFANLTLGVYLHLFLDLFQKHITPEYRWLFPFSWKAYEIGLFWPEASLYALPFVIAIVMIMEFIIWIRQRCMN